MLLWLNGREALGSSVEAVEDEKERGGQAEQDASAAREEIIAAEVKDDVSVDMTLALEGGGEVSALFVVVVLTIGTGAFLISLVMSLFLSVSLVLLALLSADEGVESAAKAVPIPRDAIVGDDRVTFVLPEPVDGGEIFPDTGGREDEPAAVAAAAAAFAFSFLDKGGVAVAAVSVVVDDVFDPFLPWVVVVPPLETCVGALPLPLLLTSAVDGAVVASALSPVSLSFEASFEAVVADVFSEASNSAMDVKELE